MLTGSRDFIRRGKVAEPAIAAIIGAAFTSIAGSLAKAIPDPITAAITGTTGPAALALRAPGARIAHRDLFDAASAFVLVYQRPNATGAQASKAGLCPDPPGASRPWTGFT